MRDLDSSPGSVNEGAEGLSGGPWLHQRMENWGGGGGGGGGGEVVTQAAGWRQG